MKAAGDLAFGQFPLLEDGATKLVQSQAQIHYVARKAGLSGDTDADFAMSCMLIAEFEDMFVSLAKALYAPEGAAAGFTALFAAEGSFHKQLGYLEALLTGAHFGSTVLAGDYCIACILDLGVALEPTVLAAYPKLAAFYAAMIATPAFNGIKDTPMYFKR
jgi:glutathione S-transferase